MSFIFLGSGQFWIILILSEDIDKLEEDRMYSNYSMKLEWNSYFSAFVYSLAFWKSAQHFFNVIFILRHIIWVDENVVEIHNYTNIEKVWKDIIYELLEVFRLKILGLVERMNLRLSNYKRTWWSF